MELSYGDTIKVDFATLPEASQTALAQRGFTHVLGNEVASRIHSWAMGEGQAGSDDKAVVKAWKESNAAAITSKTSELVADALAALNAGTLGNRVSGPRLTPVETIARNMAKKEVEDILRANKIAIPKTTGKGDARVEGKIKTADGEFTLGELVSRRLEKFGDRINAAAAKEAAKRAKEAAAVVGNADEALAAL